ncbi:EamA family transporter [Geodermatophilus sp. YIM 151500]|uniref:EamA family transporter n=1 Tax=Geodermatophilus sp. YIM 151500 TaxID=2984531 RepID=UPI0021E3E9E5|nr:EamA family transporter [Geodermatophilus sp. YIM 151500]MCV2488441.1 EamA family transporter [Geodermatophilus sp. YIM 151500]
MTTTTGATGRRAVPTLDARPVTGGVVAALGTVYLVWGSTYLAIKYTVTALPPLLAMGGRFLVAGVLLLAAVVLLRGPGVLRMTRSQAATAAVCGLLLLLGGNGMVAVAEQDVDSGLAALLIASTPLWVVALRALLRDRPSPVTVAGLVLGLVGVGLLLAPGIGGPGRLGPLLLVCLAAALWAGGTVLATRRPLPADPFVTTVVEMLAGGAAMVVVGSLAGEWGRLEPAAVPASSWIALAYLVVAGSLVAYSAYVWLLARAPVSLTTTYAYVNPVVAVALGALFLGEPLTTDVLVGGGIIVAAVALVISSRGGPRRRRPGRVRGRTATTGAVVGTGQDRTT